MAWAGLLKHLVLRDYSFLSFSLKFTWFIDFSFFFFPSCGSDHPNYGLSSGLYYNIMQLTKTAWEQLSALFRAVIQYGQSNSLLSKTLGLIRCLLFHFSNYVNDRKQRIVINNVKSDFIRTRGVCLRPSDFVLWIIMSSVIPCRTVWLI